MTTISLDVGYDAHPKGIDPAVIDIVAKHDGMIVYFQLSGPAGGNPTYGITAPDHAAVRWIIDELGFTDYPTDRFVVANDAFDYHRR
jgi:hypothetical protein